MSFEARKLETVYEALVVMSMPAIPPVACHSASIDRFSLLHSDPPSPQYLSLSVLCLATSRADAFSSSPTPLFPLSSFHLHAYASRTRRSLTNLIYERRRPAKDLPDEPIRPKPIQPDRALFIVTTCNELYSLALSALHLNGYKLMVPRLSLDFYMASSHNILYSDCAIYSKAYMRRLMW